MIFFYTSSGDSYHVARSLADACGDELVDIATACKTDLFNYRFRVEQGGRIGFVFPAQQRKVPETIARFLERAYLATDNGRPFVPGYSYCAATGSGASWALEEFAKMLMHHQGIRLDATYAIGASSAAAARQGEKRSAGVHGGPNASLMREAQSVAQAVCAMYMGRFEGKSSLGRTFGNVGRRIAGLGRKPAGDAAPSLSIPEL